MNTEIAAYFLLFYCFPTKRFKCSNIECKKLTFKLILIKIHTYTFYYHSCLGLIFFIYFIVLAFIVLAQSFFSRPMIYISRTPPLLYHVTFVWEEGSFLDDFFCNNDNVNPGYQEFLIHSEREGQKHRYKDEEKSIDSFQV